MDGISNVQILTLLAFLVLAVAPVGIALRYGDRFLDRAAGRRRQNRKKQRRSKTERLPIRSDQVERLLEAEAKRDGLDERIAQNLSAFAANSEARPGLDAETEVERIERDVLARESQFNTYLDYAWLQSETLEILTEEARLLRVFADLPKDGLPVSQADPVVTRPRDPSGKLFTNLQDALTRKADADRSLRRVVLPDPTPGSRFDATIDDETPSD